MSENAKLAKALNLMASNGGGLSKSFFSEASRPFSEMHKIQHYCQMHPFGIQTN
jgi:hypothetical protein